MSPEGMSGPDSHLCLSCVSRPREVRFRPCGHATSCIVCAVKLAVRKDAVWHLQCPTCRALATEVEQNAAGTNSAGTTTPVQRMPSFEAALPSEGRLVAVEAFLAECGVPTGDLVGELVQACLQGELATAQRLHRAGASVNARDNEDEAPLFAACRHGYTHVASWLMTEGAAVNAGNECGQQAIHAACLGTNVASKHVPALAMF